MLDKEITIYHSTKNGYVKNTYSNCFYYLTNNADYSTGGMNKSNSVKIIIQTKNDISITNGEDIVYLGYCNFNFDNSSEEKISKSLKTLRKNYEVYTIASSVHNIFGGLSNIELMCK